MKKNEFNDPTSKADEIERQMDWLCFTVLGFPVLALIFLVIALIFGAGYLLGHILAVKG